MVLEATVLIIDNSEWVRNSDFTPTRFAAQTSAAGMLFHSKTSSNPENTVGLMTMAGRCPRTLATLTSKSTRILASLASVHVDGKPNFCASIRVAQLMLKHRQNTNQRQRIVVFVASPLTESDAELVCLARRLKKNGVAIDVINFGEQSNTARLEAFVEAANAASSHLLSVASNTNLSDAVRGSPIFSGDAASNFEFGVDPELDPDLAMALRMSMEDQNHAEPSAPQDPMELTEDEQIMRAIQMSLENEEKPPE